MKYILLIALIMSAAACSTFEGMGRDMETLGKKMQGDNHDPNRPRRN